MGHEDPIVGQWRDHYRTLVGARTAILWRFAFSGFQGHATIYKIYKKESN